MRGGSYQSEPGLTTQQGARPGQRPGAGALGQGTGRTPHRYAIHALVTARRALWIGLAALLPVCSRDGSPAPPAAAEATRSQDAQAAQAASPEPTARPEVPVLLDGTSRPVAITRVAPGQPRVHARAQRTWVYAKPDRSSARLGYLRTGASSPTDREPRGRSGCPGGWHPVEPRGFVCAGQEATVDANDPLVRATREHPADLGRKLPYVYGTVRNPGPIYGRLPTREECQRSEPGLEERMDRWLEAKGEIGAAYAQEVWTAGSALRDPAEAWRNRTSEAVPGYLADGAEPPCLRPRAGPQPLVIEQMSPRVGYSFLQTFLHRGRRYGVTPLLEIVPTDRLRPIRGSDYHGVLIGKEVSLPIVLVRRRGARLRRLDSSGDGLLDAGRAPWRAALEITGKQRFFRGRLHYETRQGPWISDLDASRLDPARRMPAWGSRGEKWIDVNLTKQTLMLYEGTRPVYATLLSSGEAGLEDPEHTTATKRGIFRIHTKHLSATMSSEEVGEEFELRDVPYVQYFDEGYALHGAYWHDRFGTPKSHGCINLSPEDARRIFFFTEPQLPLGWHGVLLPLKGTVLFVHP